MQIIIAEPPNYADIIAAFPWVKTAPQVIFCWGDKIYNPDNTNVTSALRAHENVHSQVQLRMGIQEWWDKYLVDVDFRFGEEVPAHHAEFRQYCVKYKSPGDREKMLIAIAQRLSGALYGGLSTYAEARRLVRLGKT